MPKRIQRERTKGWRMPKGAIYVGRPTQWGNPYVVSEILSRERCVEAYRALLTCDYKWFRQHGLGWTASVWYPLMSKPRDHPPYVEGLIAPLRGKDLACWCPLDQPCHADVLLELANT